MEVGYSRLVTISTDNMLLTNEYRTGVGAHWTFLSDPGRKVQKDLDIPSIRTPTAAVKTAIDTFGSLDVVVNNAGYGNLSSVEDTQPFRLFARKSKRTSAGRS